MVPEMIPKSFVSEGTRADVSVLPQSSFRTGPGSPPRNPRKVDQMGTDILKIAVNLVRKDVLTLRFLLQMDLRFTAKPSSP